METVEDIEVEQASTKSPAKTNEVSFIKIRLRLVYTCVPATKASDELPDAPAGGFNSSLSAADILVFFLIFIFKIISFIFSFETLQAAELEAAKLEKDSLLKPTDVRYICNYYYFCRH